MSKRALKQRLAANQNGLDAIEGTPLAPEMPLVDTDRRQPKTDNGTYTDENTRILNPRTHMKRHGILRERPTTLDDIKAIFDDRVQTMKLKLKVSNQLLAYERRTDHKHPVTEAFLKAQLETVDDRLADVDRDLARAIKAYPDPLTRAALDAPGLGPITVAALTTYVDFGKVVCRACRKRVEDCDCKGGPTSTTSATEHASSLWAYVGLDKPAHARYEKGQAGGGNKTLRTVLWNTANSMMKDRDNPYRKVYDAVKARLEVSEREVVSRNTAGKAVTVAWKDAKPSHRHGAALRAIMKHVLADYWFVGRTLAGLSTAPLYVDERLGHTHIVNPRERGWVF